MTGKFKLPMSFDLPFNVKIIRRGICRTVILIGPYAIKIPSSRRYGDGIRGILWSWSRGIQANLSEYDWKDVDGVCPMVFSLFGIIQVYRRAQPYTGPEPDYTKISTIFNATDRKIENLGLIDGKIVWVDYDNSWNKCPHTREVVDVNEE